MSSEYSTCIFIVVTAFSKILAEFTVRVWKGSVKLEGSVVQVRNWRVRGLSGMFGIELASCNSRSTLSHSFRNNMPLRSQSSIHLPWI